VPILTPTDLRELPLLDDVSDAVLEDGVAEFEDLAFRYIDRALVPTTATVTVSGVRSNVIDLPFHEVTAISAVSIDGTALSSQARTALVIDVARGAVTRDCWWLGDQITFTITHGYTTCPAGLVRAGREYVRAVALEAVGNQPRNTISYTDASGFSYRESTPDWDAGRPTGIMSVDRVLNTYRPRAMVL